MGIHRISDEERMEIYDRLATKWAQKMQAKLDAKEAQQKFTKSVDL